MAARKKVAILGAGISGLTLAWELKKHDPDIDLTIFEQSARPGGWIQTLHKENFLFELGPRSLRPKGAGIETLKLIEELRLEDQVIAADPSAHKRYLYADQQLQLLPTGLFSFCTSPLMRGILPALWNDFRTEKSTDDDETIYDFIARRLSPELAERLIDPLTSGIYAGDIRKLSIKSCFPLLHNYEQQHGSIIRGVLAKKPESHEEYSPFVQETSKQSIISFKNGMQTLVDALHANLKQHIRLSCPVKSLSMQPNEVSLSLANDETVTVDHLFSALPAHALAHLVEDSPLKQELQQIETTSTAVVNLGFNQSILKHKGFGHLIPSREKEAILGAVWDSDVFPQQNHSHGQTRLTVMIGGAHMRDFAEHSYEEFLEIALKAIRKHLAVDVLPTVTHVTLAKQAIPQYRVGHAQHMDNMMKALPSTITLLGASYSGVSVNDCIAQARRFAQTSNH